MNTNQQTYKFHVSGMHCHACILMTESELEDVSFVTKAKTSLKDQTVHVTGDFGDKSESVLAAELSKVLEKHGYSLSVDKKREVKNWREFKIAIPIALAFAVIFVMLQKVGLLNLVGSGNVSYGTAFVIGIIASVSSCMAVVGGLLLSMSATYAKSDSSESGQGKRKLTPHLLFHIGRIVAFFVLGGVIGAIGSAFTLSATVSSILSVVIGLVMLILGINLLDTFSWAARIQPRMPKFLGRRALSVSGFGNTITPLLVGVATFFLPCGFTQSMQLYTLTTAEFMKGGLTMLAFALGTFPALALISFGAVSIQKSSKSGVFFKSAGLIVIMFALFNLLNSLVVMGVISPVFNF